MLRLTAASLLAFASLTAGCFDDSSTNPQGTYPTLLTVNPASFRGGLPCGTPGLARYVVTLTDVSIRGFLTLPSSTPVLCDSVISFSPPTGAVGDQFIVVNHFYIGTIDGYDREAIAPAQPGSRDMVDSSGAVVPPRWTTTCGEVPPSTSAPDGGGDAEGADARPPYNPLRFPTLVLSSAEVVLRGCLPFTTGPVLDASTPEDGPDRQPDATAEAETGTNTTAEASSDDAPDGAADGELDDGPEGGGGG